MSQEDAKAGTGPQAPKPQEGGAAGGSAEAAEAPKDAASAGAAPKDAEARRAAPKPAAEAGPAKAAAGKAAAGTGSPRAAGGSGARAAGRAAAGARAARAGAAGARSTAAVSSRAAGGGASAARGGASAARGGASAARGGGAAAVAAGGDVSRRGFLSWITAGWLAFGALTASTLIGTVRFLFPNVLFEPPQTFRAGFPEEYTVGDVSTRFKDQFGVWIVRTPTEIYVLSTVCTHLGCTPNWLSGEQKFKCPCHGSGFRKTGINFEGPAPRPLERYRVALADDGQILVDKTRKYQWEKGEWNDPESFLAV